MNEDSRSDLSDALLGLGIPGDLASDLAKYFFQLGEELRTRDLEKSSVGKFVETIVQVLQALDPQRTGYDISVGGVDKELSQVYESRSVRNIPDESRVPLIRIARAMYALRSKRGIIHKNEIDPNLYDLEYVYGCSQWIVTELVRLASGIPISDAQKLVERLQRPVNPILEDIMGRPLVLDNRVTIEHEILMVLFDMYSREAPASRAEIGRALDRRSPGGVTNALKALRARRWIEGDTNSGYRLTRRGVEEARRAIEIRSRPGS